MSYNPQLPTFAPIQRFHKTEEELNASINVVKIKLRGKFTLRRSDRRDVVQDNYEAELEVPVGYNVGHKKLAANRYVRDELHGIRVRTVDQVKDFEDKPVPHKRRVRDFISENGMRDNKRLERSYEREMEKRQLDISNMEQHGIMPNVVDHTQYNVNGDMPLSDKYVDV